MAFSFSHFLQWALQPFQLNSHEDFGDEQIMTSRVLGTSKPMQPADVDSSALADLRRGCSTLGPTAKLLNNITYPVL